MRMPCLSEICAEYISCYSQHMSDNSDISASMRIGKYIRMANPNKNVSLPSKLYCVGFSFKVLAYGGFQAMERVQDVVCGRVLGGIVPRLLGNGNPTQGR